MVELLEKTIHPIASFIASTDSLERAVEMASNGKFNVITLDLKLADSDREKSLRAIRKLKENNVAVVVISGLPVNGLKDEAMAAGADAFIQKDGSFNSRAVMVALHIATLKLPKDSYRSDSFLGHVDLLDQIVHTAA